MSRRFVIGDIHGCYDTLRALIERQLQPTPFDQLYFLGDYIDRGPNSKAVLDYLQGLRDKGFSITLLRGNHEQMFLEARYNEQQLFSWLLNGGTTTLQSFGVVSPHQIPDSYFQLIENMPFYVELPDCILVHAGLNLAADHPFSDTHAMLWTRHTPYYPHKIHHKIIIHGHTPTTVENIRKNIDNESFIINLDAGCVWTQHQGLGNLCGWELNSKNIYVQPNIEK